MPSTSPSTAHPHLPSSVSLVRVPPESPATLAPLYDRLVGAIAQGDVERLRQLVVESADSKQSSFVRTALDPGTASPHSSVQRSGIEAARELQPSRSSSLSSLPGALTSLMDCPSLTVDGVGQCPLVVRAAASGSTAVMRWMLEEQRCDWNARSHCGWTPLIAATYHGRNDMLSMLLDMWRGMQRGSQDMVISTEPPVSPVSAAASASALALSGTVLDRSALDLSTTNIDRSAHALSVAQSSVAVDTVQTTGTTSIYVEGDSGGLLSPEPARQLEHRASVTSTYSHRLSTVDNFLAVRTQSSATRGATDPAPITPNSLQTPVTVGSRRASCRRAPLDMNARTDYGVTALHCAVKKHHLSSLRMLVESGADVNPGHDTLSPLMMAALSGSIAITAYLISHGAEVNMQCKLNGWTALMYATLAGPSSTLCQLLVSHGADVNVKNWLGVTAVHIARQQGHRALSDYLDSLSEERHRRVIQTDIELTSFQKAVDAVLHQDSARLGQLLKGDNKLLREYGSGDGVKYGSSDALKYGSSDGVTLLLLSTIQGDAAIVRMILVFFSHVDVIRALLDAGSQLVPACPVSNLDSLTRDEQMLAFLRSAFTSHGDSGTTPTTVNSVSGSTVPRLLVDISTPASPLVEQRRKMHRIIPDAVFGGAGRSRALSTSSAATQLHRQHQALTIDHQPRMGKKKIRNVEASAAVDSLLADNQKTTESGAVAGAPSVDAMVSRLSRRSGFAMDAQESGGVGRNIIPSKIGDSVLSLETSSSSTTDARRTNSPHADTTNGVTSSAARPPLVAAVGELRARSVHPSETTTLAEFLRSIDLEALLPRLETAGRVTSIQALSELGDADMDAVVGATMGERRIIRMGLGYWRLAKIKRAVERERRRIDEMDGGGTASNSSGGAKTLSPATTSPTAHAHGSADMHAYYLKLKGDASGPP